jgi:hypothetical protein
LAPWYAKAQHRAEKFAKKLLGEKEIESILHRLDRLTQEEGRMTMAQTLEVVYGLVNSVEVVIKGTQRFSAGYRRFKWGVVLTDGKASVDGIWKALGGVSLFWAQCYSS